MVAEALWVLFESRMLPRDASWLHRAAGVVGVTMGDVRAARDRMGRVANYRPPRRGHSAPGAEAPAEPDEGDAIVMPLRRPRGAGHNGPRGAAGAAPSAPKRAPTRVRQSRQTPLGTELFCPRCGNWKRETEFAPRADRPGHRRPWCQPCATAYGRERYVPVGSPLLEERCPRCKKTLWGPDAQGEIVFAHEECPS